MVAAVKAPRHRLASDGIHAIARHPACLDGIWRAGTQVLLARRVWLLAFVCLGSRFGTNRSRDEELFLMRFLVDEYPPYRDRVQAVARPPEGVAIDEPIGDRARGSGSTPLLQVPCRTECLEDMNR